LVIVFGTAHQAVNTGPQVSGKPAQGRSGNSAVQADKAELCSALQSTLSAQEPAQEQEVLSGQCFAQNQDILFIIPTAPNPANSQLAYSFDRAIDSIQRAVGDRGFLFDRFVFPWDAQTQREQSDANKQRAEERRRRDSETTPGMLLFR